uniref:Uncharacterized protein n=1 Tax=Candidatus Kentrum eta TaxID=2126337 RepID=A0A450UI98_9GAMM|nr:MAG: hypothetical protein BECKH772A_GA0070896_1004021 [Candidatus Kentron sp. H]VFJ93182.1 MAG: hypothetical protein BECKH772B_GA0070898_1003921 [Candidatus Kentron sp. H]VFK00013.1 MAG: hypothetical protein BECKH772C_GA0070978_1003821 [Candidatus Kentron sp. H]
MQKSDCALWQGAMDEKSGTKKLRGNEHFEDTTRLARETTFAYSSWGIQEYSKSCSMSSSFRGNLMLREGTTVEMACLYTIWLTVFLRSTTN